MNRPPPKSVAVLSLGVPASILFVTLLLCGCLNAPPGTVIPCPPPRIIELHPEDGGRDVPVDDTIVFVFDHPVDTNAVDTNTVIVIETSTGDTIEGDVFHEPCFGLPKSAAKRLDKTAPLHDDPHPCATVFFFDPTDSLDPGEEYTLILTPGIEDTAGIPLEDTITFTFHTEDTLPDPPPWIDVFPEPGGEDIPVDMVIEISFDDDPPAPGDGDILVLTLGPDTIPGTITWDPADSTLTLDPADSLRGDTTYTVILTVPDDCAGALCPADSTYTWTFTTEDPEEPPPPAPPAPQLLRLLNGSLHPNTPPSGMTSSLFWMASSGATTYHLQVATDPGFVNIAVEIPATAGTSHVTSTPVYFPGNTYYWRVSATGPGGASAWSTVWTFTVSL